MRVSSCDGGVWLVALPPFAQNTAFTESTEEDDGPLPLRAREVREDEDEHSMDTHTQAGVVSTVLPPQSHHTTNQQCTHSSLVCVCEHTHTHTHTHTDTHTHTHASNHTHTHIYTVMCVLS